MTAQLNGAQTSALLEIIRQHEDGSLTDGQARSVMSVALGIGADKAESVLDGTL